MDYIITLLVVSFGVIAAVVIVKLTEVDKTLKEIKKILKDH